MKIAVSVIVPIYNAEKYLTECLESLVKQTLQEIEFILINDCSTDHSLLIMQQYQEKYPDRISIYNTKHNSGPGGARNLGLSVAQGEYIGFVDSDDVIAPNMYAHLYEEAKRKNYDVVDTGMYYEEKDMAIVYVGDDNKDVLNVEKRKALIVSGGFVYSKIYRRDYISKHGLKFRENCILEDMDFVMYIYATAETIGNVKEVNYWYRNIKDSASKEINRVKYYENVTSAMRAVWQKMKSLDIYEDIREAVEYSIIQLYSYALTICLIEKEDGFRSLQKMKELSSLKKELVKGDYLNRYVQEKMKPIDIEIMAKNDNNPEELYKCVRG